MGNRVLFLFLAALLGAYFVPSYAKACSLYDLGNLFHNLAYAGQESEVRACKQIRSTPQCQGLAQELKSEGKDPEQYLLQCTEHNIFLEPLQEEADSNTACAVGAFNSVVMEPGYALGDVIAGWGGELLAWATNDRVCNSSPDQKKALYDQFNQDKPGPMIIAEPSPNRLQSLTCKQIATDLAHRQNAILTSTLANVQHKQASHQTLSPDEKSVKDWYDFQLAKKRWATRAHDAKALVAAYLRKEKIKLECSNPKERARIECSALSTVAAIALDGYGLVSLGLKAAPRAAVVVKALAASEASGITIGVGAKIVGTKLVTLRAAAHAVDAGNQSFHGERGATVAFEGAPPSVEVFETTKPNGAKVLTIDEAVKDAAGKVVTVRRELPVDQLTEFIDSRSNTGRRFINRLISSSQTGTKAVISLDINNVKLVSDGFKGGRAAGDAYIRNVAAAIRKAVGADVPIARNGGDEVVIVLNNKSPAEIEAIQKKILDAIHNVDVHSTFRQETIARAQEFRTQAAAIEASTTMTAAEKASARSHLETQFHEYASGSQEGVSMGAVVVGKGEKTLEDVLPVADQQMTAMKIAIKGKWGQSVAKYGGVDVPGQPRRLNFKPDTQTPATDPTVGPSGDPLDLRSSSGVASEKPTRVIYDSPTVKIVEYRNALGQLTARQVESVVPPGSEFPVVTSKEIFVNQTTGLIDGANPRGAQILESFRATSTAAKPNSVVGVRLDGLKYINYFEKNSVAGDQALAAVGKVIERKSAELGIAFKMRGSDFAVGLPETSGAQARTIAAELASAIKADPAYQKIFAEQKVFLQNEIARTPASDTEKLNQLRSSLQHVDEIANQITVNSAQFSSTEPLATTLQTVNP